VHILPSNAKTLLGLRNSNGIHLYSHTTGMANRLIPCANFFTLNSDAPHKHSLPFNPVKRVVIWTYFEVILP